MPWASTSNSTPSSRASLPCNPISPAPIPTTAMCAAAARKAPTCRAPLPSTKRRLLPMQGQPLTLPVVMGAGLVDSLNPCAFALLMVFIATMLAMIQRRPDRAGERAARGWLLSHGGVYVIGIFLTYLALGLG